MGKRCEAIDCPYLAEDGTCLLNEDQRLYICLARKLIGKEEKDKWVSKLEEP